MSRSEPDDTIVNALRVTHAAVNARHGQMRANLLDRLPDTPPARSNATTAAWRFVAGGVGLGAIATMILLVLWLFAPTSPAVAMERMARALQQVHSYSFRMESVYTSREDEGRTVRQVTVGDWRTDPVGMHAEIDIVETLGTNTSSPAAPKQLLKLEETHQAKAGGIIVDHLAKEYWTIDEELDANSIGNPQVLIFMVRQRRGRVLRDLGAKTVDGRSARGLVIILDDTKRESELGVVSVEDGDQQAAGWEWRNVEIEAWIDSKTNLPIEFRCVRRRGDDLETTYLFHDLKWNVDFKAETFAIVAPEGYRKVDRSP